MLLRLAPARLAIAPSMALALAASVVLGLTAPPGVDYGGDAGPAIRALVHGDLSTFAARQPLMGSFSLLVRAPFAGLAELLGGGQALAYRLGVIPCALAAGLVGVWLARRLAAQGRSTAVCALAGGACLLNPVTFSALYYGHPEELLGAALCVAAVLAATDRRPLLAGAMLGLALATKQWALLAVGPVLVAAPHRRAALATVALGLAAALTLPLLALDSETFTTASKTAAATRGLVLPDCVWWPLATPGRGVVEYLGGQPVIDTVYTLPGWLAHLTHPLIVAVALPLTLPLLRHRGGDALGLLALLFLLRCLLDPWNNGYYHVPFLLALAAWEGTRRRGFPVLTVGAMAAMTLMTTQSVRLAPFDVQNVLYLAWTVPLLAHLALATYRRPRARAAPAVEPAAA